MLAQVFNYGDNAAGLTALEPIDAYEYIFPGLPVVTTAQQTRYVWDGSAWSYIAPTHGVWIGAENSPDLGLPEYGDEGLADGDMGVSNTAGTPIWWRFCAAAREWFRVAELGQSSDVSAARASWFDVDHLPVVAGSPVTAQGWDSFTADSCSLVSGSVEIAETATGGLYSATGTVPTGGQMAVIIRDLATVFPVGVTGTATPWGGSLTVASSSRRATLQTNPSWSPPTWYIGGASNTSISASVPDTATTVEVYVTAAGICRVYLDRADTPALTLTGLVLATSSDTRRASLTLSSIAGGTAKIKCTKYAAIAFNT